MVNIPECLPITVEPSAIKFGLILPRFEQIILNCETCSFDETSTVTIDGFKPWRIIVNKGAITENQIKVLLVVPPKLILRPGVKTVTVTTGNEVWTGEIEIQ
jgi:hypothetical protein